MVVATTTWPTGRPIVSAWAARMASPSSASFGAVGSPEELLARYAELTGALQASTVVAGYCWTQLTDTAQERNGLLYADRTPKADPAEIARLNRRPATSVPADAIAEIQIVHAARGRGSRAPDDVQ